MGRPPSAASILRNMKKRQFEPKTPIASEMFLPNLSGIARHPEADRTFWKLDCSNSPSTGDWTHDGNFLIQKHLAVGSSATIAANSIIYGFEDFSTDVENRGLTMTVGQTVALTGSKACYGLLFESNYKGTGTTFAQIGVSGQVRNTTTGTITTAKGGEYFVRNQSSGDITTGIGARGALYNSGSGKIITGNVFDTSIVVSDGELTTACGFRARNPVVSGSGSIPTMYGFCVDDLTTPTTAYGFVQLGTNAINSFANGLTLGNDLTLAGGGTIGESATILTILPDSGSYTRIGDATTTTQGLNDNDDLLVTGFLEVANAGFFNQVLATYGNVYLFNNTELRFYDNGNYVGFKAPALSADTDYVWPATDGNAGDALTTDGSGVLSWKNNESEISWSIVSPAGLSGSFYYGGYYLFGAQAEDWFIPAVLGTANASYAAHAMMVLADDTADTITFRVTGTSITDAGVRTPNDSEDIVYTHPSLTDEYKETTKKWIGQVQFDLISGTAKPANIGLCKYHTHDHDIIIDEIDTSWIGGANDANPNIILRHHKATGWTSQLFAPPIPPAAIASMNADHVTEIEIINGEQGGWKKTGINTTIDVSEGEGYLIEVVTTANKAIEHGDVLVTHNHA